MCLFLVRNLGLETIAIHPDSGNCSLVMAGFIPAIHVFLATKKEDVDARVKPGLTIVKD
jgi:hypothetical protein